MKNCYTTGETKVAYGSDSHAVIGNKSSGTVENCYYLSGLTADTSAAAKTADELEGARPHAGRCVPCRPRRPQRRLSHPDAGRSPTYDRDLHGRRRRAPRSRIDGADRHAARRAAVVFAPAGRHVFLHGVRAFGYLEKTGELTVQGGTVDESVTLAAAARRSVTFTVTPADANAAVTVLWNGQAVAPESDGSYSLPYGDYQYLSQGQGLRPRERRLHGGREQPRRYLRRADALPRVGRRGKGGPRRRGHAGRALPDRKRRAAGVARGHRRAGQRREDLRRPDGRH